MIAVLLAAALNLAPGLRIVTDNCNKEGACMSGLVAPVAPNLAYTAMHVLRGSSQAWVVDVFGNKTPVRALDVVHDDPLKDGAVRVMPTTGEFPLWYPTGKEPKVGEELYWQGRGWYAKGWYIEHGTYYGLDEDDEMEFGRGAHPGMSGGGVFNEKGEVVGVLLGTVGLGPVATQEGIPLRSYGAPIWRR